MNALISSHEHLSEATPPVATDNLAYVSKIILAICSLSSNANVNARKVNSLQSLGSKFTKIQNQTWPLTWTHVCMKKQKPSSPLDAYMQKQMCINAGAGVEFHCVSSYWSESIYP